MMACVASNVHINIVVSNETKDELSSMRFLVADRMWEKRKPGTPAVWMSLMSDMTELEFLLYCWDGSKDRQWQYVGPRKTTQIPTVQLMLLTPNTPLVESFIRMVHTEISRILKSDIEYNIFLRKKKLRCNS